MASRLSGIILSALLLPTPGLPSTASPAGGVALRNTSWDSIQVEIRLGTTTNCDLDPALAVRTLRRNEAWAVVANGVVCWRREASPGATPLVWTAWQSRSVPSTGVDNVTL
jgi:hypothetical protein